jgi:cytochrome P450
MVGIVAPTTFIGSAVVHLARHPEHHTLLKNDRRMPWLEPDGSAEWRTQVLIRGPTRLPIGFAAPR